MIARAGTSDDGVVGRPMNFVWTRSCDWPERLRRRAGRRGPQRGRCLRPLAAGAASAMTTAGDDREPQDGRRLRATRGERERDDPGEAAADVKGVGHHPVGEASKARPSTWPRPTNISAIRMKKTAAIASIGTTNWRRRDCGVRCRRRPSAARSGRRRRWRDPRIGVDDESRDRAAATIASARRGSGKPVLAPTRRQAADTTSPGSRPSGRRW